MRHLLFVVALSSSVTPFLSGREAPSSSPATVQSAVALGPHEHRGRLLAHGTACEGNPTFGCVGNSVNSQQTCCTECAKAGGGTLGLHGCGQQPSQAQYHGTAGTGWNEQQCGCSDISAAADPPLLPPSPPPSPPPPSPPPTEHQPGIAPLDFGAANVTNSNLGGLCGQSCQGTIDGTGVRRFNTTTGLCTFHDIQATEGTTPCLAAHEMYYRGVGTTLSGTQVDLRVTNVSRYLPF